MSKITGISGRGQLNYPKRSQFALKKNYFTHAQTAAHYRVPWGVQVLGMIQSRIRLFPAIAKSRRPAFFSEKNGFSQSPFFALYTVVKKYSG